jgi:hypothetical protein
MKRAMIMLLIGFAAGLNAQQVYRYQPLTVVTVHNPMTPLPILDHFARNYPGVIPYWGLEGKHYVARYIDPATTLRHKITYDRHGMIMRQENELNIEDCPAGLQAYYFKNYPNEALRVWSYEEDGDLKYYFKRRSRTVWFDRDGNFLRRRLAW